MLIVTEKDPSLDELDKLPPSLVKKVYLTEGQTPVLDYRPTIFGSPIYVVYLGNNLRAVETFVSSVTTNRDSLILVSPLSRWGLYNVKLKNIPDLIVSNQLDSLDSKVILVKEMTGLSKKESKNALVILRFNFSLVQHHLDLLQWCAKTKSSVEQALSTVEMFSYSDILFYLCGSPYHTRDKYIRTLAKYRNAKKGVLKYLKDSLDDYIDVYLYGKEAPKDSAYLISKLSRFLYLDDALRLRHTLDSVKDLSDLLKGEIKHA